MKGVWFPYYPVIFQSSLYGARHDRRAAQSRGNKTENPSWIDPEDMER